MDLVASVLDVFKRSSFPTGGDGVGAVFVTQYSRS